nr:MAG TPA: L,D-transpeptidase C-terminal domain [Caudoviricetes sp.]
MNSSIVFSSSRYFYLEVHTPLYVKQCNPCV